MTRDDVRALINEARERLHDLGVQDRMRELSRGVHVDLTEAMEDEPQPVPATEADIDAYLAGRAAWARALRANAEAMRGIWKPSSVQKILGAAAEIEESLP